VTLIKLVRPANADAAIVVTLSGRVINWTCDMILEKVVGIVVIVLVFRKTIVLKDGQTSTFVVIYDTLDTSRYSVVKFRRFLNTLEGVSVVMEGDNVKEDNLARLNVSATIVVSVLLRDKSKEPEILQA